MLLNTWYLTVNLELKPQFKPLYIDIEEIFAIV